MTKSRVGIAKIYDDGRAALALMNARTDVEEAVEEFADDYAPTL